MIKLNLLFKSVLKCHVWFCLIASLIACVRTEKCVLCVKAGGSCNQLHTEHGVNYQFNYNLDDLSLMHGTI